MHINKFLFFLLLLLFNCKDQETSFIPNEPIDNSNNNNIVLEDSGSGLLYQTYNEKIIPIYYYIPNNINSNTAVLFNIHPSARNGEQIRDFTINKAEEYNFIIISPEFSEAHFPGGDGFNLGNVYVDGDNPTPESLNDVNEWAFSIIEPIFDLFINNSDTEVDKYHLLGHSRGGQFAHRFMLFNSNGRFDKILTSGSGWYTVLDNNIQFPYGLNNSILTQDSPLSSSSYLIDILNKNHIVQIGSLDNDPDFPGLRHNEFADAQGFHRLERAIHFYNQAESLAQVNSLDFNWTINIVSGLSHDINGSTNTQIAINNGCDLIFN